MEFEVTDRKSSGAERRLRISISPTSVREASDRAASRVAQQVRVPGFRPGKAPRKVLEARIGIDAARGEVVVLMDSDGQHPVGLVGQMLQRWREGADVVYAIRRTRHDQSALQAGLTGLFYRLINAGNRVQIPANAGDFRLMDKRVVDALKAMPERNRFMKGLYAWVGFSSTAVDYDPLPRINGSSNFGLRGSFALAFTGMLAFSIAPLRILTMTGVLLAGLALGYGAWVIAEYFVWGIDVPGYATLVVGMMFFSGIQLLSIGVLAEYVGRIYEEVKQRPLYVVSQRWGKGL